MDVHHYLKVLPSRDWHHSHCPTPRVPHMRTSLEEPPTLELPSCRCARLNVGDVRGLHTLSTVCQLASPALAALNYKFDLIVAAIAGAVSIPARFEECWRHENRGCSFAAVALKAHDYEDLSKP